MLVGAADDDGTALEDDRISLEDDSGVALEDDVLAPSLEDVDTSLEDEVLAPSLEDVDALLEDDSGMECAVADDEVSISEDLTGPSDDDACDDAPCEADAPPTADDAITRCAEDDWPTIEDADPAAEHSRSQPAVAQSCGTRHGARHTPRQTFPGPQSESLLQAKSPLETGDGHPAAATMTAMTPAMTRMPEA